MRTWSRRWSNNKISLKNTASFLTILFTLTGLLLSACGGQEPLDSSQLDYFIPPTLANTAQAIVLITPTPIPATPTPSCVNNLDYLEDVTIPDGSAFSPGADIEKIWKVANSGSCDWGPGYRLTFSGGESLGAEEEQSLFPARAGSEAEIRLVLTAPENPGRYTSAWVAIDPLGVEFGDVIFLDIIVDDTLLIPVETPESSDNQ
jgi:hypothetical protein